MTLREKTYEVSQLARELARIESTTPTEFQTIRRLAGELKRKAQNIIATARAAEKRNCAHIPVERGHLYTESRPSGTRRVMYFHCAKCGKERVKVVEVSNEQEAS